MLLEFANLVISIIPFKIAISLVVFVLVYLLFRQAIRREMDLGFVALLLCIIPSLTPFLTIMSGYDNFTAMNYELQTPPLILAAMILIMILFFSIRFGYSLPMPTKKHFSSSYYFNDWFFWGLIGINVVLLFFFLESGSILNTSYGSIKLQEAPYSSLVHQFFNLSIALLLASMLTQRRHKVNSTVLILFIIIALLFSRRNMVAGLGLLLIYIYGAQRISFKQILLGGAVLAILIFVGEARNVGIINFLSGERFVSNANVFHYYTMAGGGANIFLSTIGVVDINLSGKLEGLETFPISTWPLGITESKIYQDHGYAYNGGMHLASVLYWNFGLLGVVSGGVFFGMILKFSDKTLQKLSSPYVGGLETSLAIMLILHLSTVIWYGPIGLIKGSIALFFAALILEFFPRKR